MNRFSHRLLVLSGLAATAVALLHLAIPLIGPEAYAWFRAPAGLVDLARAGHPRAAISCIVIASILGVFAAYAFSGAGWIRRLPLLRVGLAVIATVLILRGLLFVPVLVLRPDALARICDCRGVDAFIVGSSLLCLAMGAGYALGARGVGHRD